MHITYLFDPLCGWCYGAGPALKRLRTLDGVTVAPSPTGLFAGEGARVMDTGFATYAWQNDQRIARLTGQDFSETYRTRILSVAGGLFDSAPSTLGLTAVHLTAPDQEFTALEALQRARYVAGRDTSTLPVVRDILEGIGLGDAAAMLARPGSDLMDSYRQRLSTAHMDMARFHIKGVPALILDDGIERRWLANVPLFGKFEDLTAQLNLPARPA